MHTDKAIGRRSPHAGSIFVPFAFFSGLLLAVLIAYVVWLMPPQTPEQQQASIPIHQSQRNFILAKKMIAHLVPAPLTRWSGSVDCAEIGRGVWYAKGRVEIQSASGKEIPLRWNAIFLPATSQPLYLIVGSRTEGDYATALRQAGISPGPP